MAEIDPEEPCPCDSGLLFKECHGPKVKKKKMPEITRRMALKVIPEPAPNTRTVVNCVGESTVVFISHEEGLALVCGNCASDLVVGMRRAAIRDVVLCCNKCGAFNET
jgi:hypothetical protein